MFTWNFQYVSKTRLAEAFNQLMLDPSEGDILIRIHTAIHLEDEAVDLARFIAKLVPGAHIFGTSTSAPICWGKLIQNQCVVSVTQMSKGSIRTASLPTFGDNRLPIDPDELCKNVRDAVITDDTKLMLTFLTGKYLDVYSFVDKCNDYFPHVQMIGGLANTSEISLRKFLASGFVFDENGWSNKGIIVAAISGDEVESFTSYATGVQALGEESEITDTFGTCILSIDGKDAAHEYRVGVGDELISRPELTNLFPFVYSDASDIPILVSFNDNRSISDVFDEYDPENAEKYSQHPDLDKNTRREMITANHNVSAGKKLKRAFIYDRKIMTDNRLLFRRVENFEKAETIFGYSCIARSMIYANCVKWELSVYENTNMCGCITEGEIACVDGRNTFANCSFVVSVMGEEPAAQRYNPFAFSHTDSLVADNSELLNYLYDVEKRFAENKDAAAAESLKAFVRDCEMKLLYSDSDEIPSGAAMKMDIQLKGIDRICMINVYNTSSMKVVFPQQLIDLTKKNYISKCLSFSRKMGYNIYLLEDWHVAVGAPSYMVALSDFVRDMEQLQRELFETTEDYIAVVPMFCVIDDCTVDNVSQAYYSGRVEMAKKNIQFHVRDANSEQLDEESIRERYHMVNVINYAISHDKVIPYFQGIYDNKLGEIHHYEALMRLEDENGKVYYPASFLDVARCYGLLYDSISKIMIKKVFDRFRRETDKSVSINIGIRDIKNRDISEYIYGFLATAEHPENFVFEILENEDIDDYNELMTFVDKVHELGGLIAIDDFGCGFSNLQHIISINSDFLKLDGSIIRGCAEDPRSANLIELISGWKKLSNRSVQIIAEYVENEGIQHLLLEMGIDFSQGYLFSKPEPEIGAR
ncbi:EAL domain, c-di-GMP-specific phosphodiesterase class I (or its enzymatically inactive variant) [Ruminococcus sp. YE71]|uniref:EAL domain-containing protein n=1 Tax=unclassified Ruminococcus TaxID=2608920 RepID=UPI00088F7F3B|nr:MULTISPECIES: EAL domain-containing protein [unclassified Ruminococcus]SDA31796.1 EAL domain, c-di-GMP-specific phosphodiesterase class I (or its enzymatically inactive variant) [Ruminococcus sp. YE78]SFW51904.1 EAL domain, c-di-GMP-specific phosphodiesterase class I (or its enzymatically inactive variant) [Ruminococcus sp. YE71]